MPLHGPLGEPPRLEGPRLVLEPFAAGTVDAARELLRELAPTIAPECGTRAFVEGCLAAMAAGGLDAWVVREHGGPPLGMAWLLLGHSRRSPGELPSTTAGIAWLPGMRRTAGFDAEVFLLLLSEAFEARGFWSVTPRQPRHGAPERRHAPILRGEWPALRASLQARLAG